VANILQDFDYSTYYRLLEEAKDEGIRLVHNQDFYAGGGFTFAWRRCSEFSRDKMVEVAVSFCSPKDQFCRKIGASLTLYRFIEMGSTIMLPVGSEDSAHIVHALRSVFHSCIPDL